MHSRRYITKKKKRNSERGKYGNEVKRQKLKERADTMRVTSTVKLSGAIGEHAIELLSCDEVPMVCWVRINGEIFRPRTARGFVSLLGRWLWKTKGEK